MDCVKYYTNDGRIIKNYEALRPKEDVITKIEIDFIGLGKVDGFPLFVLEGYQKYMFQKYSFTPLGKGGQIIPLAGFQVGGYRNKVGWVIFDVNLSSRKIKTFLLSEITSIAIIKGIEDN